MWKCYKEGEAAEVLWDVIPEVNMPHSRSIEPFNPRKWNKHIPHAWRKDLGDIDYGV